MSTPAPTSSSSTSSDTSGIVWTDPQTIRATFENFTLYYPSNRPGFLLSSPDMQAHGLTWTISIYPGGVDADAKGFVSAFVGIVSNMQRVEAATSHVRFRFRLAHPTSGEVMSSYQTHSSKAFDGSTAGISKFLPRGDALINSVLVEGALVVDAELQITERKATTPTWTPKTDIMALQADYLKLLKGANEMGDVTFLIGEEEFSAHRHVLSVRSPALYELVDEMPQDTPVPINNVGRDEFATLLRYVYANETPSWAEADDDESDGPCPRATLALADKFGCTGLKLISEAELVENRINVDTAADLILLADCMNCALLKESAVQFFADNVDKVMASQGWSRLCESAAILSEMMEIGFGKKKPVDEESADGDYMRMHVSTLRTELEKRRLDLDGSKEILANRLEKDDAQISFIFSSEGDDEGDY